jgi:hypothetical protein
MAVETTTGAVATAGLAALLAGAFGQVAADVMMVVLASISGAVIALSGNKSTGALQSLSFFLGAVFTSLTLAWALASLISGIHPMLESVYAPTIVAFLIGTQSTQLGAIAGKVVAFVGNFFKKKIEG